MKIAGTLLDRFAGCMLGGALGDAIGELAFKYRSKKQLLNILKTKEIFTYTDDTAMSLGIAEELCTHKCIDIESLGKKFKENYEKEPWRGYGFGPPKIFSLVKKGYSFRQASCSLFNGTGSYGNGAAMRIWPVGLFYYNSPQLAKNAYLSAEVTHTHRLGKEGALVLALAISLAIKSSLNRCFQIDRFINKILNACYADEFKAKLSLIPQFIYNKTSVKEVALNLGTNVTALGSVPFAIYCFLKNPNEFDCCLYDAVLSGGDRDTIGAMACAISGAYIGKENIPKEWISKLENGRYIEDLSRSLCQVKENLNDV